MVRFIIWIVCIFCNCRLIKALHRSSGWIGQYPLWKWRAHKFCMSWIVNWSEFQYGLYISAMFLSGAKAEVVRNQLFGHLAWFSVRSCVCSFWLRFRLSVWRARLDDRQHQTRVTSYQSNAVHGRWSIIWNSAGEIGSGRRAISGTGCLLASTVCTLACTVVINPFIAWYFLSEVLCSAIGSGKRTSRLWVFDDSFLLGNCPI